MKISTILSLALLVGVISWNVYRYFRDRQRMKRAEGEGVVVYARFVSSKPVKFFGRPQRDIEKITLNVQEPGETAGHEVTIRTRVNPLQRMTPGMLVPVAIDPRDSRRVYPASEEAAKRAVVTGSRLERRVMQQQMRTPGRRGPSQPSGYQPPPSTMRRR